MTSRSPTPALPGRRRVVLALGLVPALTGCIAKTLHERASESYDETVSAVLVTSDGQKLIVTAPRFHYIFDAPAPLVRGLRAPYRKSLRGSLLTLKVESSGECHVYYTVTLDAAASPADQSTALADGFSANDRASGRAMEIRGLMRGRRYAANGVHPDASQVTLNQAYTVRVEAEPSGFALALTPLAKAADGVLRLAALPLVPFLLPLMLPGPAGLR